MLRSARPSGKPPLHVPDMGAHIRQGLSHMLDGPITPEEVPCSPPVGNRLVAARAAHRSPSMCKSRWHVRTCSLPSSLPHTPVHSETSSRLCGTIMVLLWTAGQHDWRARSGGCEAQDGERSHGYHGSGS